MMRCVSSCFKIFLPKSCSYFHRDTTTQFSLKLSNIEFSFGIKKLLLNVVIVKKIKRGLPILFINQIPYT